MLSGSPVAKEPHSFQEPRTAAEQGCACAGRYVSSTAIRGMAIASLYIQCTEVQLEHRMPGSAAELTCVCLAESASVSECVCGILHMLHVGNHKQGLGVLHWQRLCHQTGVGAALRVADWAATIPAVQELVAAGRLLLSS